MTLKKIPIYQVDAFSSQIKLDITNINISIIFEVATLIVNKLPRVNKVLYDITSNPPSTIEWE